MGCRQGRRQCTELDGAGMARMDSREGVKLQPLIKEAQEHSQNGCAMVYGTTERLTIAVPGLRGIAIPQCNDTGTKAFAVHELRLVTGLEIFQKRLSLSQKNRMDVDAQFIHQVQVD